MKHARSIDSSYHHLWSDALHFQALANQTHNKWDRGTYVRASINFAWTAFESACSVMLNLDEQVRLGGRFKDNFNTAIKAKGESINWGAYPWKNVLDIYQKRKNYTHKLLTESELFENEKTSSESIDILRYALTDLSRILKTEFPYWAELTRENGWADSFFGIAHAYITPKNFDVNSPNAIRMTYTSQGEEHILRYLHNEDEYMDHLQQLLDSAKVPISTVRLYRGDEMLIENEFRMRGSS